MILTVVCHRDLSPTLLMTTARNAIKNLRCFVMFAPNQPLWTSWTYRTQSQVTILWSSLWRIPSNFFSLRSSPRLPSGGHKAMMTPWHLWRRAWWHFASSFLRGMCGEIGNKKEPSGSFFMEIRRMWEVRGLKSQSLWAKVFDSPSLPAFKRFVSFGERQRRYLRYELTLNL